MAKTDKEKARNHMFAFLKDDSKKSVLLRGVYDEGKLNTAFFCLQELKNTKGSFVTNANAPAISDFLKDVGFEDVKTKHELNRRYEIGKFNLYLQKLNRSFKITDKNFTIIYLQAKYYDDRFKESLICKINETKCNKVILVTKNDERFDYNWLAEIVDDNYRYDAENDDPKTYHSYKKFQNEKN